MRACVLLVPPIVASLLPLPVSPHRAYLWLEDTHSLESIASRIEVPQGYERIKTVVGTFQHWLRHLPLKKGRPPVYLFNGQKKGNQEAHVAVVEIEVGKRDLQQCADALIRLRAEYLYSVGEYDSIRFKFTSGHGAEFRKWIQGYRPVVNRNAVKWVRSAEEDSSYANFRRYLNTLFIYAGTYSLSRELQRVRNMEEMRIGDIFIQGGFPGHAAMVVDMAEDTATEEKLFLLAQSYMPAQDVYILNNPADSLISPWYNLGFGDSLYTPEWTFSKNQLKRF